MSDETTTTGGWGTTGEPGAASQTTTSETSERAGFCQDCGKPLTQATVRNVGAGVFCEPCLTARVGVPNPATGYTAVPNYAAASSASNLSEPHPVFAAILGFIPGVGAMYNGQFAKGIVHLAIFAVLVSLSDNVNGIFGLFVAGWVFYMAFEAYHTAVARRDGLPLPNAFGLNDIGERLGFGKGWGNTGSAKGAASTTQPTAGAASYSATGYAAAPPVPGTTTADWVGYVPPTAFAGNVVAQQEAMAAQIQAQAMRDADYYSQPAAYAPTYSGPGYATVPPVYTAPPAAVPTTSSRRFPVGAFWLIGLGVLILLANVIPDWRFSTRWWLPILFAGLSIWTFTRRVRSGAKLVCIIRWPVILMVLAVMFALHAANYEVTFGLTCSILLIIFGGLLLLERTVGATPAYVPAPLHVTPENTAGETQPRAAWNSADAGASSTEIDSTKGGL